MTRPQLTKRGLARRAGLVRAASDLILSKGYHNVSVADIVGRLEVSHGTFYKYFDNVRDILDAVVDYNAQRFAELLLEGGEPVKADDLDSTLAQITRVNEKFYALVAEHPNLLKFTAFEAASIDVNLVLRLLTSHYDFVGEFAKYLRNGVDSGFLRADLDVEVAADLLITMLASGATDSILAPPGQARVPDIASSNAAISQLVRYGMGAALLK